ncbi:patched domain-containing protein 3-like [Centruroides sculpturatus]|uniref:patched domain-containing protein 3-like n=1 Tax=Centruroides sculpturatus TaxID=218467 RepID=UPI000C6E187A|nr:patched domain-containing protein 3-like [Centruroides sculpturatus]
MFCIYASACIFFTYIFQITFFGGCMALSGYREKERIHPFVFWKICYIEEDTNKPVGELDNTETDFMMKFFKDKLGSILILPPVKIIVMFLFITNFIIGIWGMTYLEDGMDIGHFLKSKSIARDTILTTLNYFSQYPYPLQIVINETLNYADPEIQEKVEDILSKIEEHSHTSDPFLTLSWLKYYKEFSNTSIAKFSLGGYDLTNKQEFIDGLINVFLRLPPARQFKHDILFNNNYTEILASRFIVGCKNMYSRKIELQLIQDLQKICDESTLSISTHSVLFPLMEHELLIRGIVLQLAWVIGLLIIVIFFLFIPNLICAVCVAIAIITTICETVGYMALWNVNLDMVSVILLILSVGFSINYPTHVSFAFVMAKNKNPNERLVQSIYEVGWPIFQGSVSTILGVVVLAFQDAHSFKCFFKIVVLTAVLTAFHALFVLPVILSLIGNTVNNNKSKKKKKQTFYNWFIRYKEQFNKKNEESDDRNEESEAFSTSH